MSKQKFTRELIFLYIYFLFAAVISYIFHLGIAATDALFILVPSIFILNKKRDIAAKVVIQSIIFGFFTPFILEPFGQLSHNWQYINTTIEFRIFGLFPIDSILFAIFYNLFIVSFYIYFFDPKQTNKLSKKIYILLALLILGTSLSTLFVYTNPTIFIVSKFYMYFIIIISLIILLGCLRYKGLFTKFLKVSLLLLPASLSHEYLSLALQHWKFEQGFHVAYIPFFNFVLPLEELLWLFIIPMGILIFFETFSNNRKSAT